MKFIYADSLDFIDPNYDFVTESHAPGRQVYWDDQYPHEYMRTPPYDGARRFLRFDGPACIDRPVYGDCGAFSYVNEPRPPYTA
jgi:hypothetical protein